MDISKTVNSTLQVPPGRWIEAIADSRSKSSVLNYGSTTSLPTLSRSCIAAKAASVSSSA